MCYGPDELANFAALPPMHIDAGIQPGPSDAVNVKCWGNNSVVVRVIDICPCFYAPQGKEPYFQYDCCYKSQNHIKSGQVMGGDGAGWCW